MTSSATVVPDKPAPTAWHTLTTDAVPGVLQVDPTQGLPEGVRHSRLERHGPDRLPSRGGRSNLRILIDQFVNVMLLLLIAVAVVSAVLDLQTGQFPKDAVAIGVIVLLNALLGYVQESRAEKALEALQVPIGGGSSRLPLARLIPPGQLQDLEDLLEPYSR